MKYTEYLENIETILEKKTEIETYCDYKDKFFLSKEVVATYEFIRNEGIVFLEWVLIDKFMWESKAHYIRRWSYKISNMKKIWDFEFGVDYDPQYNDYTILVNHQDDDVELLEEEEEDDDDEVELLDVFYEELKNHQEISQENKKTIENLISQEEVSEITEYKIKKENFPEFVKWENSSYSCCMGGRETNLYVYIISDNDVVVADNDYYSWSWNNHEEDIDEKATPTPVGDDVKVLLYIWNRSSSLDDFDPAKYIYVYYR